MRQSKTANNPRTAIVSGTARGLSLIVPKGLSVRPTSARARKALFDSLSPIAGSTVADLFAGAGSLGFEAASRGADEIIFVESNAAHCKAIAGSVKLALRTGLNCRFSILTESVESCGSGLYSFSDSYDYVFSDPPYSESLHLFHLVIKDARLQSLCAKAKLIWELPPNSEITDFHTDSTLWTIEDFRRFGGTSFLILTVSGGSLTSHC